VCPVEEKAKIDICESDQWVADFDSANFGLSQDWPQAIGESGARLMQAGMAAS
jgi:hypothetical protein